MDELAQKYSGRAEVFFVYGAEAHPGHPDCTGLIDDATLLRQGATIEDFRVIAQSLHMLKGVKRRILLDEDGPDCAAALLHLPGAQLNSVVVIGSDGKVVFHQMWLDVDLLDQFLWRHLAAEARPLMPDLLRGINDFGEYSPASASRRRRKGQSLQSGRLPLHTQANRIAICHSLGGSGSC